MNEIVKEWVVPSNPNIVEQMSKSILDLFIAMDWPEDDFWSLEMGFRELFLNAILHGNMGITGRRTAESFNDAKGLMSRKDIVMKDVKILVAISKSGMLLRITDEGEGFDWKSIPDPTEDQNLMNESGRGIYILRRIYNEVKFNKKGNSVTISKYRPVQSAIKSQSG